MKLRKESGNFNIVINSGADYIVLPKNLGPDDLIGYIIQSPNGNLTQIVEVVAVQIGDLMHLIRRFPQ